MSANPIVPQPFPYTFATCPNHDIADLALEIFTTTASLSLEDAGRRAFDLYPELVGYVQQRDAAGARAGKAPVADGTPRGQDRLGDEVPDPLRHPPNGRLHASSLDPAGRVPWPSDPERFSPGGRGFEGRQCTYRRHFAW